MSARIPHAGSDVEEQIMTVRLASATVLAAGLALPALATHAMQASRGAAALKTPAALKEAAPATFNATFDTSTGTFVVRVQRDWAPHGADRFYNLVKNGFYDDTRFFRVISGFMVQFGIHGDPAVSAVWRNARIPPDPVKQGNKRGFVSFAMGGSPDTRTTQVFINFGDNSQLDASGFAAFGQVTSGMDVVDKIYSGYGEGAPRGRGPEQGRIQAEGNAYLSKDFPRMDYVKKATVQ
jgi:peptidyl-prolyl cis-trans isomerase A (cyclophilin A)